MNTSRKVINFVTLQLEGFSSTVFRIENHGYEDGKCSMTGYLGRFYTDFIIDPLLRNGYNCTLDYVPFKDGWNAKDIGSLRLIQSGEKDAFVMVSPNPPIVDGIKFIPAILDTFVELGSAYNTTDESSIMDIIDLYWNMDSVFYITFLINVSILFMTYLLIRSIKQKYSKQKIDLHTLNTTPAPLPPPISFLGVLIRTCLNQDSDFGKITSPIAILCLSFAIFQFFIANIALNEIGSDLKVFKDPKVVKGYADIIERNDIQVLFFDGDPQNAYFSNASKDSPEGKIWSKRMLVSGDDAVSIMGTIFPQIVEQKLVAILRELYIEAALLLGLQYSRMSLLKNSRPYIVRDETGKHLTDHLIYGSSSPDYLKSSMENSAYVMRESGIAEENHKIRIIRDLMDNQVGSDSVESRTIQKGSMPEPILAFHHIIKLFLISAGIMITACLTLLLEFKWNQFFNFSIPTQFPDISVLNQLRNFSFSEKLIQFKRGVKVHPVITIKLAQKKQETKHD